MRAEIDKIKGDFDQRMFQHTVFKSLIKYKNKMVTAEPIRNEDFEKELGVSFYERQQIAHHKMLQRWDPSRAQSPQLSNRSPTHAADQSNALNLDETFGNQSPKNSPKREFNKNLSDQISKQLEELRLKARIVQSKAEDEMQQRIVDLQNAKDILIAILELLTSQLEVRMNQSQEKTAVQSYFLDHLTRLQGVIHLMKGGFLDKAIFVLAIYDLVDLPSPIIRPAEYQQDLSQVYQLQILIEQSRDHSFQCVL